MLYWPRLLIVAHSMTLCLDPFMPFYLYHESKLNAIVIASFISTIYLLRSVSAVWSIIANFQPHLYGKIITALILLSSLSYIFVFVFIKSYQYRPVWTFVLFGFCAIINGLFYQPLGILINGMIVKILGDYRVLFYGSYLRWRSFSCILMTGLVGLVMVLTGESCLSTTLFSLWISGVFLLCFIALFNTVQPATLEQLDIDKDQAPLLLKDARILTADQASTFTPVYKPYSVFGEQLSHISEEDDSQLDRVVTNAESLRQVTSYDSYAPSFYSRNTTANSELHHYYSRYTEEQAIDENQNSLMIHVYALALLPLPTTTDPLVALLSKEDDEETDEELFPKNYYYYYQQQNNTHFMRSNLWKKATLNITLLLMGTTNALLNTFLFVYLHSTFAVSILNISVLIAVHTISEMLTHYAIEKWYVRRINLIFASTLSHASLILCYIVYPILKPNYESTCVILIILQAVQAGAFQLIWSSGIDQVQTIVSNQYDRMKERARASLLFSSLGPALGSILAGYFLNNNPNDYILLFKISVATSSISFVVSWGWTSVE